MKKSITISCMAILTSVFTYTITLAQGTAKAENIVQQYQPLKIGDRVPGIPFQLVDADKGKTYEGKLSDYKGKLVILDFWASWCKACLHKFPKMDTLQQEFGDKIKVIMVNSRIFTGGTGDALKYMEKQKASNKWPYRFTLAVDDSIAYQLFPSYGIPHYAWINGKGRVVAITDAGEVTKENIQKVLNEEDVDLTLKKDFFPNKILLENIIVDDDLSQFSIFKKGKIKDDVQNNSAINAELASFKGNEKQIRGHIMKNMPLVEMYKSVLPGGMFGWQKGEIILEVSDPSKLDYKMDENRYNTYIIKEENLYNYEIIVTPQEEDSINSYMLRDLNKYSGYYGRKEKRKVNCLVLESFKKPDTAGLVKNQFGGGTSIETKNGKVLINNASSSSLVYQLISNSIFHQPMVDESRSGVRFDFEFDAKKPPTLKELNKSLEKYGLVLGEKQRELNVLVISDRK